MPRHPAGPGPGPPWSGCVQAAESQGRREAAGLCRLLARGPRGARREPAASISRSRAPRYPSGVDVPQCNADGHEVLVKIEGWVASSCPTTSLGSWCPIWGTHLSGEGKSNLSLLLKLSPRGGFFFFFSPF